MEYIFFVNKWGVVKPGLRGCLSQYKNRFNPKDVETSIAAGPFQGFELRDDGLK